MAGQRLERFNYFIAIQISNKDILEKVASVQTSATEKALQIPGFDTNTMETFKDAMIPTTKLHITVRIMQLEDGDLETALTAFKECCSSVHQEFLENPMKLTIQGVGNFSNSVVFVNIQGKSHLERLCKLSELFREKLTAADIKVDQRPIRPHMTIAKMVRCNKDFKEVKKYDSFPPEMWSRFEDTEFGTELVTSVQLLRMGGDDNSYYKCHGQYDFV